ncbi:hypothetical protein QJS66_19060 [Kocuria rhizophila]|nr:hypothetical protein QJS66_19060 [Kocuria rhizophila]
MTNAQLPEQVSGVSTPRWATRGGLRRPGHHLPPRGGAGCQQARGEGPPVGFAHRVDRRRCATPSPSTSRTSYRTLDHAGVLGRGRRRASPQRAFRQGRRLGVLLRRDQRIRGRDGYHYAEGGSRTPSTAAPGACTSWRCSA